MLSPFQFMRRPRRTGRLQRGLSLVELMVGITVGLFVVAAASLVVTTQLGENRRLLLETQLQQDLRATADIVTRELRRAGATSSAEGIVWQAGSTSQVNSLQPVTLVAGNTEVEYRFERAPGITGPFGFKLEGGVVKSRLGGVWQEMTDGNVMTVTAFTVTPAFAASQPVACPRDCNPDPLVDDTSCWPTLTVRSYVIDITAVSRVDDSVSRSLQSQVRLGNDMLQSNLVPASGNLCP